MKVFMIPVGMIAPSKSQPRKFFDDKTISDLSDSIKKNGILQPLTVRCTRKNGGISDGGGKIDEIPVCYEIIAGERRLRAAIEAGLSAVPCLIIDADDKKSAELSIIENLQREDLNIFEQAAAIASLIDIYGLTQEQAASQLSASQSFVANKLRILRLTEPERSLILSGGLGERHARAVLRLPDAEKRLSALKYIVSHNLNAVRAEEYVERLLEAHKKENSSGGRHIMILKDIKFFYNTLDRAIGTMEKAGLRVKRENRNTEDGIEVRIRISNNPD